MLIVVNDMDCIDYFIWCCVFCEIICGICLYYFGWEWIFGMYC